MSRIQKEFIKKLQGREFVLFSGLIDLAHQDGLKATDIQVLQFPNQENGLTCIVRATVETEKGVFQDIGDANPTNVNANIAPHIIRMASTRALARAMRVAVNVGMTCYEEMMIDDDQSEKPNQKKRVQENVGTCKSCGAVVYWGKTKNGKNNPFDDKNMKISHFSTCPNATQHSKKNNKTDSNGNELSQKDIDNLNYPMTKETGKTVMNLLAQIENKKERSDFFKKHTFRDLHNWDSLKGITEAMAWEIIDDYERTYS